MAPPWSLAPRGLAAEDSSLRVCPVFPSPSVPAVPGSPVRVLASYSSPGSPLPQTKRADREQIEPDCEGPGQCKVSENEAYNFRASTPSLFVHRVQSGVIHAFQHLGPLLRPPAISPSFHIFYCSEGQRQILKLRPGFRGRAKPRSPDTFVVQFIFSPESRSPIWNRLAAFSHSGRRSALESIVSVSNGLSRLVRRCWSGERIFSLRQHPSSRTPR